MKKSLGIGLAVALLFAGCTYGEPQYNKEASTAATASTRSADSQSDKEFQKKYESIAKDTVKTIQNKDFKKLALLANPKKGIVFSVTPYLTDGEYATLSIKDLKEYSQGKNEKKQLLWGIEGGSGEEVKLNFSDFYKEYIKETDYLGKNSVVSYGDIQTVGSDTLNYKEKFQDASAVMFYNPGTEANGNMDWKAMILVYQQEGKKTYLAAVLFAKFTP